MKLKGTAFYQCDCGHKGWFTKGESDTKCFRCNKQVEFVDVIWIKSKCQCCGNTMTGHGIGGINSLVCFSCKAPIDLVYNKKANIMVSL